MQGAGGVGGLLYLTVDGTIYVPFYDNNGNITRYLDSNGNTVAQYTYDAFGNTISQSGPLANIFHHRFSTKYLDSETGLYYYGYRFYHPVLMRWLNRDPIEEEGGGNLYKVCDNSPVFAIDRLGLSKYWNNYMRYHTHPSGDVWKQVGGNLYWLYLTDGKYDNSCALRVSRSLVNSGEIIPTAPGRWVAKDYTVLQDKTSRQGSFFKKGTVLHAEKPGSRYELSAEKMKGCLNGIFTGEKLKEKRYFVQNSKAVKYAE